MVKVEIPGRTVLTLCHILLDFNGTVAVDGKLISGVKEKINCCSTDITFHVITADTFGSVERELQGVQCSLVIIPQENQAEAKQQFLYKLGAGDTLAVGNGINDELMVRDAALGIAVLQEEGVATRTLLASDLVIKNILDLFGYIENPGRLVACLRC